MAKAAKNASTPSALEIIDRNITAITKKGKALRLECHQTLVLIIDHYIEHGDFTRLPRLEKAIAGALGSSISAAMNTWVARFVPSLKWNDDKKEFENVKGVKKEVLSVPEDKPIKMLSTTGPDDKPQMFFGDARKLPFFELERPVRQTPFDFDKALIQLIKRAEQRAEKPQDGDNVSKDHILMLKKAALGMGLLKKEDFMASELDENARPQEGQSGAQSGDATEEVGKAA